MTRISSYCALAALIAMTSAGCYESAFPLDPVPKAALDPKLLSSWRCVVPDDDEAVIMVVGRAREGVYAVSIQERSKDPDRYEAHASVVGGHTLLNIREMRASASKSWAFGRYVLLRPNILQVQIVSDKALKGVDPSADAVRRAIERRRSDPDLFEDGFTCVRMRAAK